ncbi:MAG: serine/threonine-protein kinase [Verrucomicrobia bacterium]|nr:serine/threonine-protein kinase [Verrucomicrobiota bacterium]
MTDPNESTERIVPKSPKKTHGDELAGLDPKQLLAGGIAAPANTSPGSPQASWEPPHIAELADALARFRFSELIGRGGMGAVYRATDLELDRTVAIKVLPPQVSGDPQFAERFVREARALAKLSHPNIVTIYDFGETDGGMFYIVMEQVEGSDLRHALRSGTITLEIALKVVPQICDALHYAHQKGIVHRDIKPENILLEPDGRVKIADFGLARVVNSQLPEWSLTATEQLMGTVKYMAPEQLEGAPDIDHRADIYSLGVVFYEMLTGELPIGRFSSPSEKRPMDQRVDSVVFKTLEKERDKRYQHAGDVKSDVENLSHEPPPLPESAAVPAPVANNLALSSKSQSNVNSRLSRKALVGTLWSLACSRASYSSFLHNLFLNQMGR